jgi:ribosomal protein S18 acetylase RimI-like enzyme
MREALEVRKAGDADLHSLVALMRDFYAEANFRLDETLAMASFSELLSREALGSVWIARNGQKAIGHAVLTVRYTMEHSGLSGYVDDLFVHEDFRGQGVASKLLLELEKDCLARKCRALMVEVGKDNGAGLRVYEKLGMHHVNDGRIIYKKVLV